MGGARGLAGRIDAGYLLVAAWGLLSLGAAANLGAYSPSAVVMITAGMAALTLVVFLPHRRGAVSRGALLGAAVVAAAATAVYPYGQYAHGPAQAWAHVLLVGAGLGLLVVTLGRRGHLGLATAVVVLAAAAAVAAVVASPAPANDVWWILQGSSHDLVHLRNIYTQTWPGSPPRGIFDLYPYLPGTTVALAPVFVLLGDVRYGLIAALLVASAIVRKLAGGTRGLVLAGVLLLFPRVLFGIEQSWTEPLLLALMAATVWSVERRRPTLAVVCLAMALAMKQHMVIVLPLAAVWPGFGWRRTLVAAGVAAAAAAPWFVAAPHAFVRGAITYNLRLPPRLDSLSLFTSAIRAGWTPPFVIVPVVMVGCAALAVWRLPRTTAGFVLGSAWLLGIFDLLNKGSFFNHWSLVVELIVLGLAVIDLPSVVEEGRLNPSGTTASRPPASVAGAG